MIISVPEYIAISSTKSLEVKSVVVCGRTYRVGENIQTDAGIKCDVWTHKGKKPAIITPDGFSLGLNSDGSGGK